MARHINISGQEIEETAVLTGDGSYRQDGVLSMDEVNKRFANTPSGQSGGETATKEDEKKEELGADAGSEVEKDEGSEKAPAGVKTGEAESGETAGEEGKGGKAEEIEDPKITVGGETKTASQWFAELEAAHDADYSDLPGETQADLLDMYLTRKNKGEWTKATGQRDQVNAETRRDLDRRSKELAHQKRSLDFKTKRLEDRISKTRELATKKITEDELYDAEGRPNRLKEREYNKVLDAQEALSSLEDDLKELQQEAAQADADHLLAQVDSLQANHPEVFATKESFLEVVKKVEKNRQFDHPDYRAYRLVQKVLREMEDQSIDDPEVAYRLLVEEGVIKVRQSQSTLTNNNRRDTQRQFVESIRRKQAGGTQSLPAGSVREGAQVKTKVRLGAQVADELRKHGSGGSKELDAWNF